MAAKQLPGRSACTTACFPPCPIVRPTDPAFFLDDKPAITYTDRSTATCWDSRATAIPAALRRWPSSDEGPVMTKRGVK